MYSVFKNIDQMTTFGARSMALNILYRMLELEGKTKTTNIHDKDWLITLLAYAIVTKKVHVYQNYINLPDNKKEALEEEIAVHLLKFAKGKKITTAVREYEWGNDFYGKQDYRNLDYTCIEYSSFFHDYSPEALAKPYTEYKSVHFPDDFSKYDKNNKKFVFKTELIKVKANGLAYWDGLIGAVKAGTEEGLGKLITSWDDVKFRLKTLKDREMAISKQLVDDGSTTDMTSAVNMSKKARAILLTKAELKFRKDLESEYQYSGSDKKVVLDHVLERIENINNLEEIIPIYKEFKESVFLEQQRNYYTDRCLSIFFPSYNYTASKKSFIGALQRKTRVLATKLEQKSQVNMIRESELFDEKHFKNGVSATDKNLLDDILRSGFATIPGGYGLNG